MLDLSLKYLELLALSHESFSLDPIAFRLILIVGTLFTSGIILLLLNINEDSYADKRLKIAKNKAKDENISRLYPKKN